MTLNEADMKNGIRPKCGAHDIRIQKWFRRPHDFRNYLPFGWWSGGAKIYNYACITCGYLESYVDPADLKKVAAKWEHVEQAELT